VEVLGYKITYLVELLAGTGYREQQAGVVVIVKEEHEGLVANG
jgi:hypothetical protein